MAADWDIHDRCFINLVTFLDEMMYYTCPCFLCKIIFRYFREMDGRINWFYPIVRPWRFIWWYLPKKLYTYNMEEMRRLGDIRMEKVRIDKKYFSDDQDIYTQKPVKRKLIPWHGFVFEKAEYESVHWKWWRNIKYVKSE